MALRGGRDGPDAHRSGNFQVVANYFSFAQASLGNRLFFRPALSI